MPRNHIAEIIERHESDIISDWMQFQGEFVAGRRERIPEKQLQISCRDFLLALRDTAAQTDSTDIQNQEFARLRTLLSELSRQRAAQGFTPSETASFVFSLKQALFARVQSENSGDPKLLMDEIWFINSLLDRLGLYTMEVYQQGREEIIRRQQQDMLELSTPVVELAPGILALPLIGTLDSARTQVVMQNLLEAIVARSADLAIVDITGVPTVDTLVAQHLLKTVAAARLMGADCLISGIRPQIAQTIIHLGVDLAGVFTKATLADAFTFALKKKNLTIVTTQKA